MKKLPLGMQDFKEIAGGNYVYVDKTRWILEMLENGKSYFLSRPRRFGKTLTVSTLSYLFKGQKECFKNTFIYDKWDFKEYPVVKLSMTELNTSTAETVEASLKRNLMKIYGEYGLKPDTDDYQAMFSGLIEQLAAKMGPVVVLIDEYDRPILDHMGDRETAKAIRAVMREFYIVIKSTEPLLRLAFLTGLTKITKAGIFSTLNHLEELSTQTRYAAMLGITETELETCFGEHIEAGARQLGLSREDLIARIRDYYDGFSFDGEQFVYNPFSLLNFFREYRLKNYWVESGLPQSLVEYARIHTLKPEDYLNTYMQEGLLTAYEIEEAPPQSFLVQSGYLTFKAFDPDLGYLLGYPNREVRDSFSQLILESAYNIDTLARNNLQREIILALRARNFPPVFEAMQRTFANIPGKLYDGQNPFPQREAYYHTVLLTLLWACELHVHAEEWSSGGQSDLVLDYRGDIYVMELKKAAPPVSLAQIEARGYAEKYRGAPYLALVGIEIDAERRSLKGYTIAVK
jgi:hypothetical protein